ncbi:class I SAM-dependent methyltransferase [Paenibacillus alvei]|uniref:class I SAM-dependent methyltransferase n=1 Tax=Paenibacillus alvei TaxID=44250 RepID=UPI000386A888|nr:methyltransferase domain-containing protein [Paenibacillus alvei]EPY13414.1 NodS family protein [Paenibacillus alvei A6-6i-x]
MEFASGHWTRVFSSFNEVPRYSVVGGYIQAYNSNADILDLACGQGTLLTHIRNFQSYIGVDYSEEGLKLALELTSEKCSFIRADIESFTTERKFDLIIMNECLYYFDDPMNILEKYQQYLQREGAFILSLHVREASLKIMESIMESQLFTILSEVRLTTADHAWLVSVLSPR